MYIKNNLSNVHKAHHTHTHIIHLDYTNHQIFFHFQSDENDCHWPSQDTRMITKYWSYDYG
jgi:hypothetical protein